MRVYCVISESYYAKETFIEGIFLSKNVAESFLSKSKNKYSYYRIEEHEVKE